MGLPTHENVDSRMQRSVHDVAVNVIDAHFLHCTGICVIDGHVYVYRETDAARFDIHEARVCVDLYYQNSSRTTSAQRCSDNCGSTVIIFNMRL